MQEVLNQLNKLRAIAPSDGFRARSFTAIVGSPQLRRTLKTRILESFSYSMALGLMAVMLMVAVGGLSYSSWRGLEPVAASLNAKNLSAEAEGLGASAGLADAQYFVTAAQNVAVALDAIANDAPDHLDSGILRQELNNMDFQKDAGIPADELLNRASL